MLGKLLGGWKGLFLAKIGPKIRFFKVHPFNPPFLVAAKALAGRQKLCVWLCTDDIVVVWVVGVVVGIRKRKVIVPNNWKIIELLSFIVILVPIVRRSSKTIAHVDILALQRSSCDWVCTAEQWLQTDTRVQMCWWYYIYSGCKNIHDDDSECKLFFDPLWTNVEITNKN